MIRSEFRICGWCGNDRAAIAGRCGVCERTRDEAQDAMTAWNCRNADHVGCGWRVNGVFTETLGHAQEIAANEWPIHHGCGDLYRDVQIKGR